MNHLLERKTKKMDIGHLSFDFYANAPKRSQPCHGYTPPNSQAHPLQFHQEFQINVGLQKSLDDFN